MSLHHIDENTLRDTFPKLWAEHPTKFHTFFDQNGMMNTMGRRAYTALKQKRRARLKNKNDVI